MTSRCGLRSGSAVGTFMNNLFRQGAFQGQTPQDAYLRALRFRSTTTQADIDLGIVNVSWWASLRSNRPSSSSSRFKQLAGQSQS